MAKNIWIVKDESGERLDVYDAEGRILEGHLYKIILSSDWSSDAMKVTIEILNPNLANRKEEMLQAIEKQK